MNTHERELSLLVSALVDNSIDEQQFARLDELIAADADAPAAYLRLMQLHAELPNLLVGSAGELLDAESEEPSAAPQAISHARPATGQSWRDVVYGVGKRAWQAARRPTPISLATSALVLGMIIAAMGYIGIPAYRNQNGEERASGVPPRVVASFTRFCDTQWPPEYSSGPPLHLLAGDRVELRGGFAEIKFHDGSLVILQGPTVFVAQSANSGMLRQGRLTAIVPDEAVGFSVTSPCLKLVDLGTEFGMHVDESGNTEVRVFYGRVELTKRDSHGQPKNQRILAEGDAARVTVETDEFLIPERPAEEFVRNKDFGELIVRRERERWREFAANVARDPDVVAYYSFDQPGQSPEKLLDKATERGVVVDGSIDGAAWAAGRWQDKSALRFQAPGDCVHLDFGDASWEELTVAVWLNLNALPHELNAVMYANQWEQEGAAHFTILKDGRIEFAVRGNIPEAQQSEAVSMQHRLGRWVHLTTVYNANEKTVRFYVNGVPRGGGKFEQAGTASFRQAQLGNWNQRERNMVGRMDEVIIYRRALKDEEIQKIFMAGRS